MHIDRYTNRTPCRGIERTARVFAVVVSLLLTAGARAGEPPLPALKAPIGETSVSGISSGAFMAVQFGTAWSSVVKGVGAIAGGPFGCSQGSGATALSTCMVGAPALDLGKLARQTDAWGVSGAIDPTANIARQKIYLFNGYNDNVVARPVSDWLEGFYRNRLGPAQTNLFYQTSIGAGHSQVTLGYGGACPKNGGEFINNCRYDQAGIILQHIYGALNPPNRGKLHGRIVAFDQAEFTMPDRPYDNSMGDSGFAFVPAGCAALETCRVHVALHGCLQSASNIGQDFVKHAGYNEWADSNHVIVLYPQARARTFVNPQACWDWWGYLDRNPMVEPTYLLKTGKQIAAIKGMVDRLAGGPGTKPIPAPANQGVLAIDRTDFAVDLVWTAMPEVASYTVSRAEAEDGTFTPVGATSGLSYADRGLRPGTAYRYRVAPFPEAVSVTTRPRTPKCNEPGTCR